jgi:transposase-like protein
VGDRIRLAVKAVLEQILEEEMTEHVGARPRERVAARTGERNGSYSRDLITPVGKIEQLRVPRDRDGTFATRVFEEYHRSTGQVEDAVLEMWLQGISQRKIAEVTQKLGAVRIGKDAVSRIAQRLESELAAFRSRRLEMAYPYLYLDATFLKVNWGSYVGDLAVLVTVGVSEHGFREVLAVETYAGERAEAYRNLLKGLIQRGLHGVALVISDDHESIQAAVRTELPGVVWQRCTVHFMRNVLAKVPQSERAQVAADLKSIFAVNRLEDARALAAAFCARWGKRFKGAVSTLQTGTGRGALVSGLSQQPSPLDPFHQRPGAAVRASEAANTGGAHFPQRVERGQPGDGGGAASERGLGAAVLPGHGAVSRVGRVERDRGSREN